MGRNIDSIKPPKKERKATQVTEEVVADNEKKSNEIDFIESPKKSKKDSKVKEKPAKELKDKKPKNKFLVSILIFLAVLFLLLATAVAGAFAHSYYYQNRVFPGVLAWGEPVGGKTVEEVQNLLVKKAEKLELGVNALDQEYTASADDIGFIIDTNAVAQNAYSKGRSGKKISDLVDRSRLYLASFEWNPAKELIKTGELNSEVVYQIDDEKINQFVKNITDNVTIKAQDSKVIAQGSSIKLIPAVYGRAVDSGKLKQDILTSIKNLKSAKVEVTTYEVKPSIIDEAAEEVRIETEAVISRPIILTYQGAEYRPSRATVASWISYVKKPGEAKYTLVVDTSKMNNYFTFLESKINIASVPKRIRVENGTKSTVTQEGKNGLAMDRKVLGQKIASQLPVASSVSLAIPTYVTNFKTIYDRVVVENDEKYIVVDLSDQTITAYLKGGQVVGSWGTVTGKISTPTPTGKFLIYAKTRVQKVMSDHRTYWLYDVPYISWFKGDYGLHAASGWYGGWRSEWEYGLPYAQRAKYHGSHGCVNLPLSVAKFIYEWAPFGTPVYIQQ